MDWYSYLAQQSVTSGQTAQETVKQASPDATAKPKGPMGFLGGDMSFWLIIGGTFLVMYFLMIRPQRKEEKRKQEMLSALSKGVPVVTTSGIIGTVAAVKDDTVTLNVGNGAKMEFLRSAIANVRNAENKKVETTPKADKNKK